MKKMMGIKIRAVVFAVIFTLIFGKTVAYTFSGEDAMNFLVIGVDNASENTDVISVVRLDAGKKKVSFIQIPRDTYCNADVYQNKINHIYAFARSKGKDRLESIKGLRDFLSDALSVNIHGHIVIDGEAFLKLVDSIGGVDIELDKDITLYNGEKAVLSLKKGANHLDSASAMLFVRHRSGYIRGDLERLEMQNIFIQGLFDTLTRRVGGANILRVAGVLKMCETDISMKSLISLFSNRKSFSIASFEGEPLPGEAIKGKNGVWYYALNRRACDELISRAFEIESGQFDREKRFMNVSDESFKNIYLK